MGLWLTGERVASGISVLRIELKLGVLMYLTRPHFLVIKFSRWFSLFHHYLLGQISIILLNISWFLIE